MPREMDDIIHYVCRQSNEANPDAGVQRGTWLALSPWHHSVPTEVLRSSSDASRSCELLVSNNYCFSVFTNRDHAPERVWACITLNQVWRMTHILSACRSKQAGSFKLSHTHVWTCKKGKHAHLLSFQSDGMQSQSSPISSNQNMIRSIRSDHILSHLILLPSGSVPFDSTDLNPPPSSW